MSNQHLLPSNASPSEVALAATVARISNVPTPARDLYNAELCPPDLLPWLAWAYSLDEWNPAWNESQKRAAIANSVFVHRHKGTIGAVRTALAALGFGAQLQEWFNQTPAGDPYTYELLLESDQVGFDLDDVEIIKHVIDGAKNVRSHLAKIKVTVKSKAGPIVASVIGLGSDITIAGYEYSLVADGEAIANGMYAASGFKIPI